MGLPNIELAFKNSAAAVIKRSQKGVVGVILRDANTTAAGAHTLLSAQDMPAALDGANAAYVARAFTGYLNPPSKVLLYVVGADATDLSEALAHFATVEVDYLCGPRACTTAEGTAIAAWVKARRAEHSMVKAVLPNQAADDVGVINFTTTGIQVGENSCTPAEYCTRMAGLLAGTPMAISSTFAPLPEVADIQRLSRGEMDTAIDAGKLILYHDGEKVKVARGVNSLVSLTPEQGAEFTKIKIVEILDLISHNLRRTIEDNWVGKYANSYDNKQLLVTAIASYLEQLEEEGLLQAGVSQVGIDAAAQAAWLKAQGVDVSAMSEREIREASTGSHVFLAAACRPLDAIEDVSIRIAL